MTDVHADDAPSAPARRQFTLGACASAVALFAAAGSFAEPAGVSPAFVFTPPAGGGFDAFVALSQQLTGRASFDTLLGKRVYTALASADSQFAQRVAALNTWLRGHGGVPSDTVTQALAVEAPDLAKTVGAVMRAWYLGLVGEPPNVQVVAYERALMFEPVQDLLPIPSYCKDVPVYWAHKPSLD
jgi:fructose 5-dehydrogenase small subunit